MQRIKLLSFHRRSGRDRAFGFLMQMLIRPAPQLEVFSVDDNYNLTDPDLDYPENFLGGCAPKLRYFNSDTVSFDLWKSRLLDSVDTLLIHNIHNLEEVKPLPKIDDVIACLEGMHGLREIVWRHGLPRDSLFDNAQRKVVSLPKLTKLTVAGPPLSCAYLLHHIDIPASTTVNIELRCTTQSSEDFTTFFHQIRSWLDSQHAPFAPSAVWISKESEIILKVWHSRDTDFEAHGPAPNAPDLHIWFRQPSGSLEWTTEWTTEQIAEACYGLCASPRLQQLFLSVEAWRLDAWRDILDAPAAAGLRRLLTRGPAGIELLRHWGVCDPQKAGAVRRRPPALASLALSVSKKDCKSEEFAKLLKMLPHWLALCASAGRPLNWISNWTKRMKGGGTALKTPSMKRARAARMMCFTYAIEIEHGRRWPPL
ncbi:hypothetical protein FA95DRAFT_1526305 [Auriscalpium vulgare]|uniref:Uncharacterized protein n=1 Tax=Auriscalpium vulgare TaxID=40419 RepID=A0ACB8RC56_9AGAM|nr:hypothetical protein FA95DRAFT_1526305 [Auriscalpium vulgare]